MTAATAAGERRFVAGVAGAGVCDGPATGAAADATTDPNALAEPTITVLPSRRPFAAVTTTVPDCTSSPPENVLAALSTSSPLPVVVRLPLPSTGPIMVSAVAAAALKIVLLAKCTGALIAGLPASTEIVAPALATRLAA